MLAGLDLRGGANWAVAQCPWASTTKGPPQKDSKNDYLSSVLI